MHDLLVALVAYAMVAGSPGPSNMAIMGVAMADGRRSALLLVAGVLTGSLTWAILAAIGVAAIISAYTNGILLMKIAGGLYLLYLAFRAARSAMAAGPISPATTGPIGRSDLRRLYVRGALMHLTNPKAILGWLSIISLGVPQSSSVWAAPIVIVSCWSLGVVIFGGYAVIFSIAPIARAYRRARRWIEAALAGVFCFAGIRMLTSAA